MNKFAVIDFETTGFGKKDRILEVGIVLVDDTEIIGEWESLINPERDISNSQIHGITANDISLAPVFEEVIGFLSHTLNERVLVSHNLNFDLRMLKQEFERAQFEADFGNGFCTLQATRKKLPEACAYFGISHDEKHMAISDARSTAQLLKHVIEKNELLRPFNLLSSQNVSTPRRLVRESSLLVKSELSIRKSDLFSYIDFSTRSGLALSYLDALNIILRDLEISESEARFLDDLASHLGLTKDEQQLIHRDLLNSFEEAAKRDNFISPSEKTFIDGLARELKLDSTISMIQTGRSADSVKVTSGIKVCFTGKAFDSDGNEIPRSKLEELAVANGMVPVSSVSKKSCDLLVAQDVSSMSGKTKKARDLLISVVSVQEFLSSLEVN